MKLNFRKAASFVFMTIVLCGCKGKNQGEENSTAEVLGTEGTQSTTNAVVILQNALLFNFDSEDTALFEAQLDKGEKVTVFLTGSEPETKKGFVHMGDGKKSEKNFVHISYCNKDFWTAESSLALNCEPGILTAEHSVYSEPEKNSKTERSLKKGEIIAIGKSLKDFEEIFYSDGTASAKKAYLKKQGISTNENDILAQQIYRKISLATNRDVLEELKETLSTLEISPEIKQEINVPEPTAKTSAASLSDESQN